MVGRNEIAEAERLEWRDPEMQRALDLAAEVPDPEIPVLTLGDLGVLRGVIRRQGTIIVRLTPTYTGCPATHEIRLAVENALTGGGLPDARVETVLTPTWTTDDISEEGRRKLLDHGIAPPTRCGTENPGLFASTALACPRCGSVETTRLSQFGSTLCKALWRCEACREPFEAFKCL